MKPTSFCSNSAETLPSVVKKIRNFVENEVIPQESLLAKNDQSELLALKEKAKRMGLYGNFYPEKLGGKFSRLTDYLPLAEEESRSEYGPMIFGSESTLDIHMLNHYADEAVKLNYLESLASGNIVASYAMTEPGTCGSIPDTLRATAQLKEGYWQINAKKWFICRADRAQLVAVVVCTGDESVPVSQRLSVLIVPADAEGFHIVGKNKIFGQHQGQCELELNNVMVPENFMLGGKGEGMAVIEQRLNFGRVLRSTYWLGLAQRCFDMMCYRLQTERNKAIGLADKQLIRQHVVKVYQALVGSRSLIYRAASELDNHLPADIAVKVAKLSTSQTLSLAVDSAIQIYGAEGVSEQTPLASIYQLARTTRILDGADEALISSVGKRLLNEYSDKHQEYSDKTKPTCKTTPIYKTPPISETPAISEKACIS